MAGRWQIKKSGLRRRWFTGAREQNILGMQVANLLIQVARVSRVIDDIIRCFKSRFPIRLCFQHCSNLCFCQTVATGDPLTLYRRIHIHKEYPVDEIRLPGFNQEGYYKNAIG